VLDCLLLHVGHTSSSLTLTFFRLMLMKRNRYAFFEVPSNMMLKKLRPSIWLPTIMLAWGTVVRSQP
jgi:hypothetical protein